MIFHAQNMACHLLSQLTFIGKEECESVELVLMLISTYNIKTSSINISSRNLHLSQRFLPQLTELAARYDPVYNTEKPLHMVNIEKMLTTIAKSLVADWSSHERSELHSTIPAAHQFLHSDLPSIKSVVSRWAHAHPNGVSGSPRQHIGFWERSSLAKPIPRPTARIVVPPRNTRPTTVQLRLSLIPSAYKRTSSNPDRPMSSASQEAKLAELAQALESSTSSSCPRFSTMSGESSSTQPESSVLTPDDDWGAQLNHFGLSPFPIKPNRIGTKVFYSRS